MIFALSMDLFLVPNKIVSGGASGIATVVFHLSEQKIPVGLVIILINLPLFFLGMKNMGKSFFFKSVYSTILLSLAIDFFKPMTDAFIGKYLFDASNPSNTDLFLLCVFGGAIMGVGLGFVLRMGGSTGGTDIAAALLHRVWPAVTLGQILFAIDALIVIFAMVAFRDVFAGIYAIVVIFISTKIIDTILEGLSFAKSVYIISDYPKDIAGEVLRQLDRGVTALDGTGMFTGSKKQVLFIVLERTQIPRLKEIVKNIDPKAFIVFTDIREVLGEFGRGKKKKSKED